jgi:flavin reductase (DIM6/NTAB) family NADH-FMN oxidoreductase RutF
MNAFAEHVVSFPASDLTPGELYFLLRDSIMPRPIAWISTMDHEGRTNLAPFSFFNVCCPSPPILGFSCGPQGDNHNAAGRVLKDTERNIRAIGEFVVNIAGETMIDAIVKSSDALPHGQSEFAHAGLTEAVSAVVRPPRVAGVPVAYECRLHSITELGTNSWIMGTVVHVHIAQSVYDGERDGRRHRVDLLRAVDTRPVGRLGRANYVRMRNIETHLRRSGPN